MNQLEELKKKLQCAKCHNPFGSTKTYIYFDKCKHHLCKNCKDRYPPFFHRCPICGDGASNTKSSYHADLSCLMKTYESSVAKSAEVERQLKNQILIFQQKQTVNETMQDNMRNKIWTLEREREKSREDHHRCSECEKMDSEQNMQLCSTCHELKFEGLEDVKKNALCPACAIKKHIRKGHQTVDFFPYLSAYNFASHSPKIEWKSEELKNARDTLKYTISVFNTLSINVSENYKALTEKARRSKSTRNQLEFVEKMETFSNESKSIHVGADSELKERTKMLQESLTKLTNWCNARMEDSVDDSETIRLEVPAGSDNNNATWI